LNDLIQQLTGGSNEGFPLAIFVSPRGFAEKNDARGEIPDTKNGLRAGPGQLRASLATLHLLAQLLELLGPLR
jgi:hypothetical protein